MRAPDYLETLKRYGLEPLVRAGDLRLDKDGNIATTPDRDLQFGATQCNAIFRLVQRWRLNQPALNGLFRAMLLTTEEIESILADRINGVSPSLSMNAAAFHEELDTVGARESNSAILAGTICLVLNNLLQRFKADLEKSTRPWPQSGPRFGSYSFDEVLRAAANNFRHHDEWARAATPDNQQAKSMAILLEVLGKSPLSNGGRPIRNNVCRDILLVVSERSEERIYELMFECAKSACAET